MLDLRAMGWLLVVALCEELFFRGLLLPECKVRLHLSRLQASLLVSLLFGLAHFVNIHNSYGLYLILGQMVYAFGVGLLLSYLYFARGLRLCVIVHGVLNIVSVLFPTKGGISVLCYVLFALLVGGMGVWKMFKKSREKL